ncbi:membrane protein insertase YidC [Rivihabitans pingtungensis]|jgi:YidC/Oxa1 family membrane protein insertase|uniref:membrane protein insertase YidC n=1 Tax=Rivihabitans pingtungensis TaxID=1054498 RepID=UPI0023F555E0|nr:membrane protein insertase YidC [Rivihabitans pingtungensis]
MDSKRLILFIALSFGILLLWQEFFAPPPKPAAVAAANAPTTAAAPAPAPGAAPAVADAGALAAGQTVHVKTDLFDATIDTTGGDLRGLTLSAYAAAEDESKPLKLLQNGEGRTYVAQTGLISAGNPALPTHRSVFAAEKTDYALADGQNSVEVRLTAPEAQGVQVSKVYTFTRGSYLIRVRYEIRNNGAIPLAASAYYRLLRDGKAPEGESRMAYTFTGPAVYTEADKFQKVKFEDIDKNKANYAHAADNGWVAMLQHYFVSAWILKANDGKSVCVTAQNCRFELKTAPGGLYSAGTVVDLPAIAAGATHVIDMPLYAGPQITHVLKDTAPGLELTKDYGWVTIIATPLYWLLEKLHAMVNNWGWAIVLLTILVKAVFFPLSAASYRSMAKMKALAPRMERLKEQYGDDRMKFQQAMMEMYKTEKVNPLGGCLPIVVQIPVFIGLYWALLASVELRQAPWLGWIHDLTRPDPFYVLPALMAITMVGQTFLNPPPADPVQAKMMKIMPIAFSVMFFFFPAGLVLYWLVNNILSIAQQWYINRSIEQAEAAKKLG